MKLKTRNNYNHNNSIKDKLHLSPADKLLIRNIKKGAVTLTLYVLFISQTVKEFVFRRYLELSILLFFGLSYLSYSSVNEHMVLAIAMLICLYLSYDVVCDLLKKEIRVRNDQIYKELLNNTKEQINSLDKKKALLKELENISLKMKQIINSSALSFEAQDRAFIPVSSLEHNLKLVLLEELSLLDSVYKAKNQSFELVSKDLDKDLDFVDSKSENLLF